MDEKTNIADAGTVNDPPAPTALVEQPPTSAPVNEPQKPDPRAKGVKGVTKMARELKDAGKTRAEVASAVAALYQTGGKTEKAAKDAASVIVYNIFGPVKARSVTPPTSSDPTPPV